MRRKHFPVRIVIISGIASLLLIMTACQPTPEQSVVVDKNTALVDAVVSANNENKAGLEEDKQTIQDQIKALGGHLTMTMTPNAQVTINVDADIISPGFEKLPLVRVRPSNFTVEQFKAFIDYLTQGRPIYQMNNQKEAFTKEEIMDIITKINESLANKDISKSTRTAWRDMIDNLNESYTDALSQSDEELWDGTLAATLNNDLFKTITNLKCYMGKDRAAWIDLWQSFEGNQSQMTFNNGDYGAGYNTFEPYEGVDAERVDMTYDEARTRAEDFVHAIDGKDSDLVVYESSIGYIGSEISGYTGETSPQAYAFSFARCYNGVVLKPVQYLSGESAAADYNMQVSPESLFVVIDDEGINQAYWISKTERTEIVTEDAPLKELNAILEIFKQYCSYKFTWIPDMDSLPEGLNATLNVKRVEMNMMVIPEKNNLDNYITVPVWDFITDVEYDEGIMTQEGLPAEGEKEVSILTINAIDGSIIDREQGY